MSEYPKQSRVPWMTVAVVVLAVLVGLGLWRLFSPPAPAPAEPPAAAAPAAPAAPPAAPPAPAVQFPLPGEPPQQAMQAPAVPTADATKAFLDDLHAGLNSAAIERYVGSSDLVRRVVSTVDNLGLDRLPVRARAILPVRGAFLAARDGDGWVIAPENARRYDGLVQAMESASTARIVQVYAKHYRLFQGEYRAQGSPDRYFNDRLIAALDHLLATPEPAQPVRLVQPKVLYQFADPQLEALSAGQKALIRMGPEHAARVKAKLRDVRRELTRVAPGRAS
jgi:hypothetical protein